ncbi:MAG: hypothetical protein JWP98_642, partial [Edaphobacter sp.]|nr:hypothetical protein [Edaphobacter sp.]
MLVFPWIVCGVGFGLGVSLLFLLNVPEAEYETGYVGV